MKGVSVMATNSIRIDDAVKEEATRIASQLGLTFNSVVNILLRKFNEEKGFPFPVRLETEMKRNIFELDSPEFEALCKRAVSERETSPQMEYVTRLDKNSGKLMKVYQDGRVEYVLD